MTQGLQFPDDSSENWKQYPKIDYESNGSPKPSKQVTIDVKPEPSGQKKKKDFKKIKSRKQRATFFAVILMVFVNTAAFFIPESLRRRVAISRRVLLGGFVGACLLGTFIFLYYWYGTCESYKLLTKDLDDFDESKCTVDPNVFITTLRVDTDSKWESEESFTSNNAFWQVRFLGFGTTNAQLFYDHITQLRENINTFLGKARNLQPFTLIQYLLHTRTFIQGDKGYARLQPSFTLSSFASNFDISSIQFFQSQSLQACDPNGRRDCAFDANIRQIKQCGNGINGPFLQYNVTRTGGALDYYTTSKSGTSFQVRLNMLKQFQQDDIAKVFDGDECNEYTQVPFTDWDMITRELPYFRNCTTCRLMDLKFDFSLIAVLDFCNQNIEVCQTFYNFPSDGEQLSSVLVYNIIRQYTQSRFQTSRAQFFNKKLQKFAFSSYELGEEFNIVPQIVPACPQCGGQQGRAASLEDCSNEFDIVLHYYKRRESKNRRRNLLQEVASADEDQPNADTDFVPLPRSIGEYWQTRLGGSTYVFINGRLNRTDSQAACAELGGDLVYFDGFEEEQTIISRLRNQQEEIQPTDNVVQSSLALQNPNRENYCTDWAWILSNETLPLTYENWYQECNTGLFRYTRRTFWGGIEVWQSAASAARREVWSPSWVDIRNITKYPVLCRIQGSQVQAEPENPIPQSTEDQPVQIQEIPLRDNVLNHMGYIGSKSYYYSLQKETWIEANQRCQELGGNLVQFDSVATENTVNILLQSNPLFQYTSAVEEFPYVWFGLRTTVSNQQLVQEWIPNDNNNNYTNNNFFYSGSGEITQSCAAVQFKLEQGVPESSWWFQPCNSTNVYICEFGVNLVEAIDSVSNPPAMASPPPPSPPPPPVEAIASPPPPPTVQEITQFILNDIDQSEGSVKAAEEIQTVVVGNTEDLNLQERPEEQEEIKIDESGYVFRTVTDDDSDYKFSVLITLTSSQPQLIINQFQTPMPDLYCDSSSLMFAEANGSLQVPFTLTSNIYECEVEQCRSVLERLASSFANTELFYVLLALLMVIIVLACCIKRETDDESESFVESFMEVFKAMVDNVDVF
eukprot:TRINITY_DN2606_c0_g1_i4.p1 TRINITY_DN2606_c0_g1~~TRINITY_DN2606_c0_g1_i4.p1  ORF type:complete len:1154 (-),score=116.54 TRINITY_DN2606_c0_g1_i4:3763-6999(-)